MNQKKLDRALLKLLKENSINFKKVKILIDKGANPSIDALFLVQNKLLKDDFKKFNNLYKGYDFIIHNLPIHEVVNIELARLLINALGDRVSEAINYGVSNSLSDLTPAWVAILNDIMKCTILLHVCHKGTFEHVKLFMDTLGDKATESIMIVNIMGQNSLHMACTNNDNNVIKLLIDILGDRAADAIMKSDISGDTPLSFAIKSENINDVQLLINALGNKAVGAIRSNGSSEETLLFKTCGYKNTKVTELLLNFLIENGDDIDNILAYPVFDNKNLIMQTIIHGHYNKLKLLVEDFGAHIDLQERIWTEIITEALTSKHFDCISFLFNNCYGEDYEILNEIITSSEKIEEFKLYCSSNAKKSARNLPESNYLDDLADTIVKKVDIGDIK